MDLLSLKTPGPALGAGRARPSDNGYHMKTSTVPLSFSSVITGLKAGFRFQRRGWNGKGMFIFLVPGSEFVVNRPPLLGIYPAGTHIKYQPHIDMKTADGTVVPWLASQSDLLAEDWHQVD